MCSERPTEDRTSRNQLKQLQMALPAAASSLPPPPKPGRLAAGEWVESPEKNFSWFPHEGCFVTSSRGFESLKPRDCNGTLDCGEGQAYAERAATSDQTKTLFSHSKPSKALSSLRERAKHSCKEKIQRQCRALPLETLFLRGYTTLWMGTLSCSRYHLSQVGGHFSTEGLVCKAQLGVGGLWELMTREEGERG